MQITKERKKELTNMYLDLHRQLNDCVDNHDSAYKVQFYLFDLLHKFEKELIANNVIYNVDDSDSEYYK